MGWEMIHRGQYPGGWYLPFRGHTGVHQLALHGSAHCLYHRDRENHALSTSHQRLGLVRRLQQPRDRAAREEALAAGETWLKEYPDDRTVREAVARIETWTRHGLEALLAALDADGERYHLLSYAEQQAWDQWYGQHFPSWSSGWHRDAPIRDRHCHAWQGPEDQHFDPIRAFHGYCEEFGLGNAQIAVLWPFDPPTPLELSLQSFRRHLDLIYSIEVVSFVVDLERQWSICLNFDHHVCFGRPLLQPT
jgi:hypothetical protein